MEGSEVGVRGTVGTFWRIRPSVRGEGVAVLADGTRLKVTRAKREELERRLERLHDGT
jgi:hypothetical protein